MSGRDTPLERMPVVILAGGKGTRLREETERVPKPLVGVGREDLVDPFPHRPLRCEEAPGLGVKLKPGLSSRADAMVRVSAL